MKFSEFLTEQESVIAVDRDYQTFGDLLNVKSDIKHEFKALALNEKFSADTYREILKLKINKELLIHRVLTKNTIFGRFTVSTTKYRVLVHMVLKNAIYVPTLSNTIIINVKGQIYAYDSSRTFVEYPLLKAEQKFLSMTHAAVGNGSEYFAWGLYE